METLSSNLLTKSHHLSFDINDFSLEWAQLNQHFTSRIIKGSFQLRELQVLLLNSHLQQNPVKINPEQQ